MDVDRIASPIHIEPRTYELRPTSEGLEGSIPFSFMNPLPDTIYLQNWEGGLYRRQGSTWILALPFGRLDVLQPSTPIAPGATYSSVIDVFAAYPGSNFQPQFDFEVTDDEYRWEFLAVYDGDPFHERDAQRLPRAWRVSNSFRLVEVELKETDCAKHYSYEQVGFWARSSGQYFVPGVTGFWFDTVHVCLAFGIESNAVIPRLEARLRERGIPRDAVRIYVEPPGVTLSQTGTGTGTGT